MKFIRAVLAGLVCGFVASGYWLTQIEANNELFPFKLKDGEFVYEYGTDIPNDVKTYFDTTDEMQLEKATITLKLPEKEEPPKAGDYKGYLMWRDEIALFDFKIKDTKKPVIELVKENVTINYGEKYEPKKNVKSVKDEVDGDLDYKLEGKVDSKKAGTYTIKVTATDKNNNTSTKEFNVKVKKKVVVTQPTYTGGTSGNASTGNTSSGSTGSTSGNISGGSTSSTGSYPLTYQDGSAKITIYKEWYQNAWVYAAHLQFSNYSRFGTACANGAYGNGTETTRHAYSRLGAIFAVNGDYSSKNLNYPVARSGKVWNNKNCWVPAVYSRSNGKLMSAWETGGTPGIAGQDLATLVSEGKVSDTFSFGPPILSGGSITVGGDTSRAQRTFIGTNGAPGDIWVVVSEGRYTDGKSAGLTYRQCAQFLQNKGCTFGVPLDGGGSSTMIFKGKVLTATSQRAVVDFVYFK